MGVLALLLLPKCSTDLNYGPCPPARDWDSRVSDLVIFDSALDQTDPFALEKKFIALLIIAAAELARHEAEEAKKVKDQRDNDKDEDNFNDALGEEKRNKDMDNQLECDTCDLHFTNQSALRKHMPSTHEAVDPWPCKDQNCNYTNQDKGRLNHHMKQKHAATTSPYPKTLKRPALASYLKEEKLT